MQVETVPTIIPPAVGGDAQQPRCRVAGLPVPERESTVPPIPNNESSEARLWRCRMSLLPGGQVKAGPSPKNEF